MYRVALTALGLMLTNTIAVRNMRLKTLHECGGKLGPNRSSATSESIRQRVCQFVNSRPSPVSNMNMDLRQ